MSVQDLINRSVAFAEPGREKRISPKAFTWRGGKRMLTAIDLLTLNFGMALGISRAMQWQALWKPLAGVLVVVIPINLLWLLAAETFDGYRPAITHHTGSSILAAFLSTATAAGGGLLLVLLIDRAWLPAVSSAAVCAMVLLSIERAAASFLLAHGPVRRVLLITDEGGARGFSKIRNSEWHPNIEILGYLDSRPPEEGCTAPGARYIGRVGEIDEVMAFHRPDMLALDPAILDGHITLDGAERWLDSDLRIALLSDFYEELTGRIHLSSLSQSGMKGMLSLRRGNRLWFQAGRRLMDITLAFLGLVCLAIAFPFIALAIYLDCPGPIFFLQTRVGKNGRSFKAYKFRSMYPDAEQGRAIWASEYDNRVTRVGKILRKTHVDEFPQFLNILKGEMSAVGPRPERPEFVEKLKQEIPFYDVRHTVKPGMAGWGLVNQGYAASDEEAWRKHEYDLYYIKHQSLWFDLVILAKTFVNTFTFSGR